MSRVNDVPTPEQIAKLPRWARDHIKNLEWAATEAKRDHKSLFDSQEKTGLIYGTIGNIYDNPKYLEDGPYSYVRFYMNGHIPDPDKRAEGDWIELCRSEAYDPDTNRRIISPDTMEIRSSRSFAIHPKSSNSMELTHISRY